MQTTTISPMQTPRQRPISAALVLLVLACCLAPLWMPSLAWAAPEKRIALVIGNSRYKHVSPLDNPVVS